MQPIIKAVKGKVDIELNKAIALLGPFALKNKGLLLEKGINTRYHTRKPAIKGLTMLYRGYNRYEVIGNRTLQYTNKWEYDNCIGFVSINGDKYEANKNELIFNIAMGNGVNEEIKVEFLCVPINL